MGPTGAISAVVRVMKSRRNFRNVRTRSAPLDPKTHVFGRFEPFRYSMNFGTKWAELVQLMH
jgi:hypothetical protein